MTKPKCPDDFIRRYPRLTAHIMVESFMDISPFGAGVLGFDGLRGRESRCGCLQESYGGDARRFLQDSIRNRHAHKPSYLCTKRYVQKYLDERDDPTLKDLL